MHAINRPDGILINARLTELYKRHEQVFYDMYAQGLTATWENYDLFVRGEIKKEIPSSFLDFMHKRIEERGLRHSTKVSQLVALEALARFGKSILLHPLLLQT